MPARRREIELSVERPSIPGAPPGAVTRLSVRFEPGADGKGPTSAELRQALDELSADLDAVVGVPLAAAPVARPERSLVELIETYRPRQPELVDLLRDEGELTTGEHALLAEYVGAAPAARPPAPSRRSEAPPEDRPIAAAPLVAERALPPARPVEELLRQYRIESLRQAGAVRAQRQISFAEYMALKRHFEGAAAERPRGSA